jgi:ribosomal protein S18 acetylase RimI-like enzyme
VAELLGRALAELRELLGMLPADLEGVALVEAAPIAVGLYVPSDVAAAGRLRLAWLSARDPAAAVELVAVAEERGRAMGARALQVSERRAPGVGPLLEARGYRLANAMVHLRRTRRRAPGPLPDGMRQLSLDEAGLDAWVEVERESFRGVAFAVALTREDAERQRQAPGFDAGLFRFVADEAGPAGYLRGLMASDGTGEVETIGLAPRARGRGVGRWLLRRCEALLDARGAREVVLRVAASNEVARALYAAEGYEEVAREPAWERALERAGRGAPREGRGDVSR